MGADLGLPASTSTGSWRRSLWGSLRRRFSHNGRKPQMRYRIVKTAKSKLKPPIMIMTPWTYFDITTGFMVQADVSTTGQKAVISSEGEVDKVQPALFFQCLAVRVLSEASQTVKITSIQPLQQCSRICSQR